MRLVGTAVGSHVRIQLSYAFEFSSTVKASEIKKLKSKFGFLSVLKLKMTQKT